MITHLLDSSKTQMFVTQCSIVLPGPYRYSVFYTADTVSENFPQNGSNYLNEYVHSYSDMH